jgi:hypothetical protein
MESDSYYTIDCSKVDNDELFGHLCETLIAHDYVKIKILPDERMRYQPDLVDKDQLKQERPEKRAAIAELDSILLGEDKLNIFRPTLDNNMMVLFNNHQFLHGRTKIEDFDRHLLRVRFNLDD